jgi:hypothetical protein
LVEIDQSHGGRGAAVDRDDHPAAGLTNRLTEGPAGAVPARPGAVVITRFDCPSRLTLFVLLIRHLRMKRHVRRHADGFLGVMTTIDWRRRTLLNVSLWSDPGSVYSMGRVSRHVAAARLPSRLGVRTDGAVYPCAGDWRSVLFTAGRLTRPPKL